MTKRQKDKNTKKTERQKRRNAVSQSVTLEFSQDTVCGATFFLR